MKNNTCWGCGCIVNDGESIEASSPIVVIAKTIRNIKKYCEKCKKKLDRKKEIK